MVGTPKLYHADAEETDAAETVEEFHVEVTDYMVRLIPVVRSFPSLLVKVQVYKCARNPVWLTLSMSV